MVAEPLVKQEVEVVGKAERRRFTAAYKRRVVQEADRCRKPGEVGALLRREGLYSSHLTAWRAARARGELAGAGAKRRGPKPTPAPREAKRILRAGTGESAPAGPGGAGGGLGGSPKKLSALLHQDDGLRTART